MACKPMDEFGAYVVLGLSEGCSAADVRRAYRRLALLCHPDKNPEQNEEAEERFRDVASAKDYLLEKLGKAPLSLGGLLSAAQRRRARWCKPGPVRVERVVPVKPQQPPRVVVWACHVCEVDCLGGYSPGARKDRLQPCIQPNPQTVCFCGHPLSDHGHAGTPSADGWEKCQRCPCAKFTYVQPHSRCNCGHSNLEHSPTGFFACKVDGCPCQTFHDPGTCRVCGHDWVCHRTELRHSVPPPPPPPRSPSRSSDSSSDAIFVRYRPVPLKPARPTTPAAAHHALAGDARPRSARPSSAATTASLSARPTTPRSARAIGDASRPTKTTPLRPLTPRTARPSAQEVRRRPSSAAMASRTPRTTATTATTPRAPHDHSEVQRPMSAITSRTPRSSAGPPTARSSAAGFGPGSTSTSTSIPRSLLLAQQARPKSAAGGLLSFRASLEAVK
ncbi:dnajb6-a, partial [Symbiodinium microadriaticum]